MIIFKDGKGRGNQNAVYLYRYEKIFKGLWKHEYMLYIIM